MPVGGCRWLSRFGSLTRPGHGLILLTSGAGRVVSRISERRIGRYALRMPVKAQLGGHKFDLERLAELFSHGDPKVVKADEGFFLEATALDGLLYEASRMREAATVILARFNGVARLRDASFRPVRLLNRYVNDAGSGNTMIDVGDEARVRDTATVVVVGTAEARFGALNGRIAVNGVVAEPEAPGARYLDLASANTDVAELLL